MLLKNAVLLAGIFFSLVLYSCGKTELYDDAARAAQLQLDIDSIAKFVAKNRIPAIKDESGIYYQMIRPGNGTFILNDTDTILVSYVGKMLNDSTVERGDSTKLVVSGLTEGWQKGLKIVPPGKQYSIQPRGEIRLLVPSVLAYINRPVYTARDTTRGIYVGVIPPNSNLDYTIQILNILQKK